MTFIIRQAEPRDASTLLKLARMVHFINLPPDRDIITEKIRWSRQSFRAARQGKGALDKLAHSSSGLGGSPGARSPQFMFVIEDDSTGNTLGTSALIAGMGAKGSPNVSLQLRKREFFSEDLQIGATHVTAQVVLDEDGPTEIGGLILGPSSRGHKAKLGKHLSMIRFHYIGLQRAHFSDRLLAEMMAPITPDGRNTMWEYFGRRFINLTYDEADRFCAHSREFMTSLLPREEIYLTLLPPEARAVIGQVGPDTRPARAMLERLGFVYRDRIDPFDGGPHMEAVTDDVPLVKATVRVELEGTCPVKSAKKHGYVSFEGGPAGLNFRAVYGEYAEAGAGAIRLPAATMRALEAEPGATLGLTPIEVKSRTAPSEVASRNGRAGSVSRKKGAGSLRKSVKKKKGSKKG